MQAKAIRERPIGVFDSGVGGLTVLKAIRQKLPSENLLYLGDTARLPYGTKSAASVLRYAMQAAAHLQSRDIKMLVVACNTASAVAIDDLKRALHPLPVLGVVEPGANAATESRPGGRHLVLATEATVALAAYGNEIRRLDPAAKVTELACEMLVALAEEGWTSGQVPESIVRRYLRGSLQAPAAERPNSVILGCTHFPLLRECIRDVIGDDLSIVDSAGTTAVAVDHFLRELDIQKESPNGSTKLLATDGARRFARVGGAFLGASLTPADIELIDL